MKITGIIVCLFLATGLFAQETKPRVFIFTDINIDKGDPDDRQSLIHLLWYANDLNIEGIVPDRWEAEGLQACQLAIDAYEQDFKTYDWNNLGYPSPQEIKSKTATDLSSALGLFSKTASVDTSPLYVLVWGNMINVGKALNQYPELCNNIRLITIGTNLMIEEYGEHIPESWPKAEKPCEQYNWNGFGRNEIFQDTRFMDLWWLEINWTYEGMFTGNEPKEMHQNLSEFGKLGEHMKEVTKNQPWARYFRVGDTPSVLYVIDPDHLLDDPTESSWAGRFINPFPEDRPTYFTDLNGPVEWDYENPCNTWENHRAMRDYAKSTLEKERPEMYRALLEKLNKIYHKQ